MFAFLFVCMSTCLCVCSLVCLFVRPFIHSFIRSIVCSYNCVYVLCCCFRQYNSPITCSVFGRGCDLCVDSPSLAPIQCLPYCCKGGNALSRARFLSFPLTGFHHRACFSFLFLVVLFLVKFRIGDIQITAFAKYMYRSSSSLSFVSRFVLMFCILSVRKAFPFFFF